MGGKGNKKSSDPETTTAITESIDIKDSIVGGRDPANYGMTGFVTPKTVQFPLVQTARLASLIADRELKKVSYALSELSFKANRNMFKAVPGMLYNLAYPLYDIDSMIVRIIKIEEEGPESEIITVYATEDVHYAGQTCIWSIPQTRPDPIIMPISTITEVKAFEAPYTIAGGEYVKAAITASRVTGNEIGYAVYISNDGTSYTMLGSSGSWGVHGILAENYPKTTYTIDDSVGFDVIFETDDGSTLETITRSGLFTNINLCVLGNEFIAVQTITPVSTRRYRMEGILRGKFDTLKQDHWSGEDFFFLGNSGLTLFAGDESIFYYNGTRYFKVVPFNGFSYGPLASAIPVTITFDKHSFAPYSPTNLKANGCGLDHRAGYGSSSPGWDIVLTWSTRLRTGQGCGYGDVDTVTDAAPTWEGKFRIKVYVNGSLVRTVSDIDDDTYTYAKAIRVADCGNPYEITFTLTNYITNGIEEYESEAVSLIVRRNYPLLG